MCRRSLKHLASCASSSCFPSSSSFLDGAPLTLLQEEKNGWWKKNHYEGALSQAGTYLYWIGSSKLQISSNNIRLEQLDVKMISAVLITMILCFILYYVSLILFNFFGMFEWVDKGNNQHTIMGIREKTTINKRITRCNWKAITSKLYIKDNQDPNISDSEMKLCKFWYW